MSQSPNLRQYRKITREQRLQLLSLILQKKHTIKKAAEIIGIGASTARTILKRYENTGNIFESKADQKTRNIIEQIEKEKAQHQVVTDLKSQLQLNRGPVNFVPVMFLYYPPSPLSWIAQI